MLFNSLVFLVFLGVVLPVFYLLPQRFKKIFLLLASYTFYGYWDWRFCSLLLLSTVMDYYLGHVIYTETDEKKRKRLLYLSLLVNLTLLGFFKYFNFFVDSFAQVFGTQLDSVHLHVILPVGISFYTFQSLSYTFDLYRKKLEPAKSLLDYSVFVSFFPQLVAGPIEKAVHLLPQVEKIKMPDRQYIKEGAILITTGMFKKIIIGDTIGKYVDNVFAEPGNFSSGELICTLIMFAVQIYADFSGYSLIAKGCGKLLGVTLMDNFNQPYLASSITDFWRRWHISLSDWLKDYVYIWWLGGNRKGKFRTYLNLMATMLLGGLWHGANWTFVIWGGIHGAALAFHKFILGDKKVETRFTFNGSTSLVKFIFNVLFTFLIVLFAWLFFRASDLKTATTILSHIFNWTSSDLIGDFIIATTLYFSVIILLDV
ncbi:MAG TPA: MBOAT family O-acyltransferase, partial [Cyclobacteriaceae bacterium]|nr:MBOAT family O-acyltransferase [Cyclobacteriaceae bacterium]